MIKNKQDNGFTIIEVVLVLAIAGLIFLVVFLALPALQKSQRDNARKQDAARVTAGLQSYLADNNNQMPTAITTSGFGSGYYGSLTTDAWIPTQGYSCAATTNTNSTQIKIGCHCSDGGSLSVDTSKRYYFVAVGLEGGSSYCKDYTY